MNASIPSLVLFLGALAWAGASHLEAADSPERSIATEGVATQEYAPDRAELSVELKVVSDSREDSQTAVDRAHKALVTALKKVGVPEKDIGLRLRTIERESEWNRGRREFLGFACVEWIEVTVRKLDNLSAITEAMAGIEDLELNGMAFHSSDEGEARREALLKAADAARQKAEALAKNAGVKISKLLELREESASSYYAAGAAGNYVGLADSESGVANRSVRVTVLARYAIE